MELNKEIKFVEFCNQLKIPTSQHKKRKKDLLEWLKNFFDYDYYLKGNCFFIVLKEQIGEYQPLPRKKYDNSMRLEKVEEAKKDYEEFTIKSLGNEFKPNSKSKIAKEAIIDFGQSKYGHGNKDWVVRNFVKEPFEKYGITNDKSVWVHFPSYIPLTEEEVSNWKNILVEEHISENQAALAFYKQQQGEDISLEIGYYKRALERMEEEYCIKPILVKEWKVKKSS